MLQAHNSLTAALSLVNTTTVVSNPSARGIYHLHGNITRPEKDYKSSCFSLMYKQVGPLHGGKALANLPAVMFNINEGAFEKKHLLQNISHAPQFYTVA